MLINREHEAQLLNKLADGGQDSLVLVRGRRRVGKTYLLSNLWPRERALYFVASATTSEINRAALLAAAQRWADVSLRDQDHPSWRLLLRAVFSLKPNEPVVVILDECQYLADGDAGMSEFASELNAVWEMEVDRSAPITVILCGSALRTLAALESGGSPLYGRLSLSLVLRPFDYFDSAQMMPGFTMRERIELYAAFGGLPANLALIDPGRSAADNIVGQALSVEGAVRSRVAMQLDQEEGLRSVARYRAVLASVGLGASTAGEISARMGVKADTGLKRMLAQLVELSYLEVSADFDESRNRGLRYRLADPAAKFHYAVALPLESDVVAFGAPTVWSNLVAHGRFATYVGSQVFEEVARQAYRRLAPGRDFPLVSKWHSWQGVDRNRNPLEIDMVGRASDGRLVTGSVKYRTRVAGGDVYAQHIDSLQRLAASGKGWGREALQPDSPLLFVSAGGFGESFHAAKESGRETIALTLADLFA